MPNISAKTNLIYSDLSYKLRGAIFTVYNTLGFGHKEHVYQCALKSEFTDKALPYLSEPQLPVFYKDKQVGTYCPDFLIDSKIIVEIKAAEYLTPAYESQLLHYLKGTGIKLGLLVNFGQPRLYIKRLLWDPRKSDPHKSVQKSV